MLLSCYKAFTRLISVFNIFWFSYSNFLSVTCMICITVCIVFHENWSLEIFFVLLFPKFLKRKFRFFVYLVYTVEKEHVNFGFEKWTHKKSLNWYLKKICTFPPVKIYTQSYWTLNNYENKYTQKSFFRKLISVKTFICWRHFTKKKKLRPISSLNFVVNILKY